MKAVILDIDKNEATVMTGDGDIIGIRNIGYEIGQEIILHRKKRTGSVSRITGIIGAAAAALIITGSIGGYTYYTPYGTVSLDVNPSIEYTINRFDRVLDVNGINDDGEDILSGIDTKNLINRNIEAAIEDTIEQIDAEGYFSDEGRNYVVLTASTKEEEHTDTLLSNLDSNVKQRENIEPISFKVSDDEITEAHKQGISPGKKMMVDRLEGVSGEQIDRGEWNKRSVRDIVNEYDRIREGGMRENPDTTAPEVQPQEVPQINDAPQNQPDHEPAQELSDQQPDEEQMQQIPNEDMPQQQPDKERMQQIPKEDIPQQQPDKERIQQVPNEEMPQQPPGNSRPDEFENSIRNDREMMPPEGGR